MPSPTSSAPSSPHSRRGRSSTGIASVSSLWFGLFVSFGLLRSYDDRRRPGSTPRAENLGRPRRPTLNDHGDRPPRTRRGLLELEVGAIAAGGGCVARAPDGKVVFVRHSLPGERVRARVTARTTSYPAGRRRRGPRRPPPTGSSPRARTPGPGAVAAATSSTSSWAHNAGSRPPSSPSSWRGWPAWSARSRSSPSPATATGSAGAAGCAWRSTGTARSGSAGTAPTDSKSSTTARSPAAAVTATGAFVARWPGVARARGRDGRRTGRRGGRGHAAGTARAAAARRRHRPGRTGPGPPAAGAVHAVVGGRTYRISAGVFWQVHTGAAAALLAAVLALAGDCGGRAVVDLYAGAGLFSVPLAEAVGPTGSVLAVERDARGLRRRAAQRRRPVPACACRRPRSRPALVASAVGRPDIVVLDPPARAPAPTSCGPWPGTRRPCARLVYVSCDPASFGRDAPRPARRGLAPRPTLRAFDIFPMTEHVELVAALEPPALDGPTGARRTTRPRRARRARARCARPTRTAASSARRRSGRPGSPAGGRARGRPRRW